MKRFLLSAALLAAATTTIQAHTLDGIVKDNKTGEPLIGTVIRVKELPNVSTLPDLMVLSPCMNCLIKAR